MNSLISDSLKAKLISAFHTFLSSFILALASGIVTGVPIEWSWAFWGSIALAAVRVGVKSLLETFGPAALGGKK